MADESTGKKAGTFQVSANQLLVGFVIVVAILAVGNWGVKAARLKLREEVKSAVVATVNDIIHGKITIDGNKGNKGKLFPFAPDAEDEAESD